MKVNIQKLLRGEENSIDIVGEFEIPYEWYQNTDIVSLRPVKAKGTLTYFDDENILLNMDVSGTMILKDSISLEEIPYPFSFQMEENVAERLEKDQNDLDILSILWENIVLEIPIRYSEVTNYDEYVGDGWRVISEDEVKKSTNNPFKDLLKKIEKE